MGVRYFGPGRRAFAAKPDPLPGARQGRGGADPAPCADREGPRLQAGRGRPGLLPHTGPLRVRRRGLDRHDQEVVDPGLHRRAPAAAIAAAMRQDQRVTVITAAMCQGNKLEKVRAEFPDRFFDVGICESHAVAFAAGQAKAGCRPIVDIYSTFLQRSFDQIFQEVSPAEPAGRPSCSIGPASPARMARPTTALTTSATCGCSPTWSCSPRATNTTSWRWSSGPCDHDGPVAIRYPKTTVDNRPAGPGRPSTWASPRCLPKARTAC